MKPLRFNAVQVCWLIIGFWSTLVQAQPLAKNPAYTISVNFWGRDKGLPGLAALSIGQDPQGFIWVSTQETVSRFDGQRFTPLSLSAATGGSTSGNGGHSAYLQDRQGNRWLVGNGIAGYQQQLIMKPGQVIPRPINEAFGRAAGPRQEVIINYIPSAGHRFQYIRTQEGQIRRHLGQGRFKTLFSHPGLRESYCLTSFETNRQTLLLSFPDSRSSTSGQLLELDTTGRILQQHRFPHWLRPIRENADGSIYLYRVLDYAPTYLRQPATFDAFLYQLSRDGKLSTIPFNLGRNPLPTPTVSDLGLVNLQYDAHHDLFWLTGPHLLIAWHPEKGVVFDITKEHAALVASSIITSVYVDKTGAVWALTSNGLLMLTLSLNHFQRYLYTPPGSATAEPQSIRGMVPIGENIWVNAAECQLLHVQTGASRFLFKNIPFNQTYTLNLYPAVLGQDGAIWAAARGMIRVDPNTFRFTTYPLRLDNICISIWPQNQHRLWLGNLNGLATFDIIRG